MIRFRILAVVALLTATSALANLNFESLDGMQPDEQYRQFSLMMLVSGVR